jgi:hypothetical protein
VERALERALFPAHRVREVAHLLAVEQWDGLDPAQVGFPRAPQTRVARACVRLAIAAHDDASGRCAPRLRLCGW